jgi:hypothetical protein
MYRRLSSRVSVLALLAATATPGAALADFEAGDNTPFASEIIYSFDAVPPMARRPLWMWRR